MDSIEGLEDGGSSPSSSDTLTAELRDGQLQIVEVSGPFDKDDDDNDVTETLQIGQDDGSKYVQVLNADGKGLLHLDLLNLTFVRCEDGDGDESYRLVTNAEAEGCSGDSEFITPDSVQVVLQSSEEDNDEQEAGESYVMVEEQEDAVAEESYVMIESEDGPVFYLQSDLKQTNAVCEQVRKIQNAEPPETPMEMLQKAKALLKAKVLLSQSMSPQSGRGRRRKHSLPTPDEILSSPGFKLFLYSCKACHFRCNAVRELTQHRAQCHDFVSKGKVRPAAAQLQCARCPFRGATHLQLMRHVQDHHFKKEETSSSQVGCWAEVPVRPLNSSKQVIQSGKEPGADTSSAGTDMAVVKR